MTQPSPEYIQVDLDSYMGALSSHDGLQTCVRIEQKYSLYGYPPEVVSKVLAAGARGECMIKAEDKAIGNEVEE